MPSRKPSPPVMWAQYLLARAMVLLLRALPLGAAAAVGRGLAAVIYRVEGRHRGRAVDTIRTALGSHLTDAEVDAVNRGMYRHLGEMLAEFVRIPRVTRDNQGEFIAWRGNDDLIRSILAEGKGLILVSGHIGNWEFFGATLALLGWSAGAVARPLDNPLIDRLVRGIRMSSGQQIWDKKGALKKTVSALRKGMAFGILVDQDARKQGVFVPFFGREASTIPTHADLAIVTGAPVLAVALHRTGGPMRFTVSTGPVRRAEPGAERETERMRLLRLVNDDLADLIRLHPEQWTWMHRRWKTKPPVPETSATATPKEAT